MTYAELKAQFTAILNRTDITSALTVIFVNSAIQRAQRELRIPPTEVSANTTAASFVSLPVPSDLIEIITVTVDDKNVSFLPRSKFLELDDTSTGQPIYWTRSGSLIYMKPKPANGQIINLYYYGQMTPFTTEGQETTISLVAPDLLIYGALSYAADYYIDERASAFEARYEQIKQAIQDQGYSTDGGGAVSPTATFDED